MRHYPLLCLLLLAIAIGLSEASLFGRMKSKGDEVADDIGDAASRLKRKGEVLADDAGETVSKLKRKGKAVANQQKRELFDEDESAIPAGWRVPIFSGVADRFRRTGKDKRPVAADYVEGAKQKGRRVVDEVQRKKRELLEQDDEESDIEERGFFGGVADRLRGRHQQAATAEDADGPIEQAKKSTKRFGGDVADKLREKKREWSGSSSDDEHESDEHHDDEGEGFLQGLRSKFQRTKDDVSEGIEDASERVNEKKGSWFSGKAAKRADAHSEDEEDEQAAADDDDDDEEDETQARRGFFGRMLSRKAARKQRDAAEQVEETADSLKRKGWFLWKRAGEQAKKQKRTLQRNIPAPAKQGFFGRLSNRFRRSSPRNVADDIEDGAEKLTKKGKKALGKAATAMKRKQAEWTEDSDLQ